MKPVFITEIKSDGEYVITSIKGQNFRHDGLALPRSPIIHRKFCPFIEVIKYSPSDFISTLNFLLIGQMVDVKGMQQ